MSAQIVAVTRRAAALSRRASLMAFGGAAASVAGRPASADTGGTGRKARKRAKRICRAQGNQCRVAVAQLCETNNLDCERVLPCCGFFARCQAPEGLRCIFEEPPASPEV